MFGVCAVFFLIRITQNMEMYQLEMLLSKAIKKQIWVRNWWSKKKMFKTALIERDLLLIKEEKKPLNVKRPFVMVFLV